MWTFYFEFSFLGTKLVVNSICCTLTSLVSFAVFRHFINFIGQEIGDKGSVIQILYSMTIKILTKLTPFVNSIYAVGTKIAQLSSTYFPSKS